MPQEVALYSLGQQSKSPNLTSAHRLNIYYDVQTDADKVTVAAYGTPGLSLFANLSTSPTRGIHWFEGVSKLFVIQRTSLFEVANDGTYINRGRLNIDDTDGYVSMINNGQQFGQLAIASGKYFYIYNTTTHAITPISMPWGSGGASFVTFLDSFFIVNRPNTGQFYVSNSYDGTTWPALSFATAESNPDNMQLLVSDRGNLVLFGSSSTEIWVNTGGMFPYQRVNGAPSDAGVAAPYSMAKINGMWTGLFRDRQGMLTFGVMNGYLITTISNPDLDYLINRYTTPSDAVGFGYSISGRHFYQVTFQAQGVTWLCDLKTNAWSQLKSWGKTRHRGHLGCAFGTKFIVTDYQTGQLYTLSIDNYTDNGDPIEREIVSKHTFTASRNKSIVRRLRLDMEGGVGLLTGQGNSPQVMLQISRDGGHSWGTELWTTCGKTGDYFARAEWRRLGQARDWVFKIRITDPVKVVLLAAIIEITELNK